MGLGGIVSAETYFKETFDNMDRWTSSNWKAGEMGTFDLSAGDWQTDAAADQGMRTSQGAKFYAATAPLDKTLSNKDKDLVVQFSVKHEKREYSFCGGGYIKLMPASSAGASFGGDSPYQVMFGPDMCGYDVSRIHAIFNHEGENLLKTEDIKLEYADKNSFTHLYTLQIKPDNTYTVYFDGEEKSSGSIHEQWPYPPKSVDDPSDSKPSDWVDEKRIPDETDVKPEGYDDIPEKIPDPEASKPEDWDDEDDGEWEAPKISNPEFKGPWKQKMIDNPAYKGEWKAKQIPNDKFVPEVAKWDDIAAVGFDLWVVNEGSIFDNIIVTDSLEEAQAFAKATFDVTKAGEEEAKKVWDEANKPPEPEPTEEQEGEEEVEVETEDAHEEL